MKTLIVGNYGTFVNCMIQRFNRENVDVYVLAEKRKNEQEDLKKSSKYVDYSFRLDSDDVRYVIQSIKPDSIVYTGVHNTLYDWNSPHTYVKFSSDLINVLQWAKFYDVKRFVYLSSTEIYEDNKEKKINEDVTPKIHSTKSKVIYIGEELTKLYNAGSMDTVSLRIPFVYGTNNDSDKYRNAVTNMGYEYLKDQKVHSLGHTEYTMIYEKDATDVVFKALVAEKLSYPVYNISSHETITDKGIMKIFSQEDKRHKDYEIIPGTLNLSDTPINGERFEKEFSFSILTNMEKGLKSVYNDVQRRYDDSAIHKGENIFERTKAKKDEIVKKLKMISKPFQIVLENILFFAIAVVAFLLCSNIEMFQGVDFFILYIVIMSAGFGIGSGLFAVGLTTLYQILYSIQTGQQLTSVIGSYGNVIVFLFRIIISIIVSYTVLNLKNEIKELTKDYEHLESDYELLGEINQTNIEVKQIFEERLLNYNSSIGKIYSIVSDLYSLEGEQIIERSLNVIYRIMNVQDISIYHVTSEGYCHFVTSSSMEVNTLSRSFLLSEYPEMNRIFSTGDIFVNYDVRTELPRMAAPIVNNNKIIYIVMLWNIDFEQLTIYLKNLFMVLAKIISSSLAKAEEYEVATHNTNYYEETNIMREDVFNEMLSKYARLPQNQQMRSTLLEVDYDTKESITKLNNDLTNTLRESDRLGFLPGRNGKIYILAQCTNAEIGYVQNKLAKIGYTGKVVSYEEN